MEAIFQMQYYMNTVSVTRMATKISTGLASRHTQLTGLYLFGIKSSWIKSQKYEVEL